jgi:hypothetical protein
VVVKAGVMTGKRSAVQLGMAFYYRNLIVFSLISERYSIIFYKHFTLTLEACFFRDSCQRATAQSAATRRYTPSIS